MVMVLMNQNKVCKEFLQDIGRQRNGYQLGDLWRYSESSLGLLIPILRTRTVRRNYKMVEEAKKVHIEDTGDIGQARVTNDEDTKVFIRSGSILTGGTQERATVSGMVIEPNSVYEAPVKCVHASKGIIMGTSLHVEDVAPPIVQSALFMGSQSAVWGSVSSYTASMAGSQYRIGTPSPTMDRRAGSDDLIGTIREVERKKRDVEDAIKEIPIIPSQVGAIIFDATGIVGLETFDSPLSWKAMHQKVLSKYDDVLAKEQEEPLFTLKESIIPRKIKKFIQDIIDADTKMSHSTESSFTWLIEGDRIIGEFTDINEGIIHLIAFRKEQMARSKRVNPTSPIPTPSGDYTVHDRSVTIDPTWRTTTGGTPPRWK